jgi:dipeptidyl-peptidase-4
MWVVASADPTEQHVWRVPLGPDGSGGAPERLTQARGVHGATCARAAPVCVVTSRTAEGEFSAAVWRDGREVGRLQSVAERPPWRPRVEWTTVGAQGFRAAVIRPRDFDPARTYPVIVHVYGGPGFQMVEAVSDAYLLAQWLADQGFVVVAFDGRGTPGRGRAWERAIRGDLVKTALADQAAALAALPLDTSRAGIFGWSFGGYVAAMAVLVRPDVFHAAVAGAPVTDWLDYDTHYTERYLGLPDDNPDGYRAASALTHAAGLSRPLLLIHGTADDNVYFSHSLKLARSLFTAGRPFEFLPLAGFTHMVPDPQTTTRLYERIAGFFRARLGGAR